MRNSGVLVVPILNCAVLPIISSNALNSIPPSIDVSFDELSMLTNLLTLPVVSTRISSNQNNIVVSRLIASMPALNGGPPLMELTSTISDVNVISHITTLNPGVAIYVIAAFGVYSGGIYKALPKCVNNDSYSLRPINGQIHTALNLDNLPSCNHLLNIIKDLNLPTSLPFSFGFSKFGGSLNKVLETV